MNAWVVERLADVCELKPPKAEARKRLAPSDLVSFVPMNDLQESAMYFSPNQTRTLKDVEGSYTYFANGDVLLAKITPCFENGKLGVARNLCNGVGFGSSEYFVLRPSARLLPQYLYYFLSRQSFRDEGANVMTGAVGHRRVPKEHIEDYLIPIPPLSEQRKIVDLLERSFEEVEQVWGNVEKNIANAANLFESILKRCFSEQSGWKRFHLGDHVKFVDYRGKTPPKTESGVRLITAKNVKMGFIQPTPEEFVDPTAYDRWMTRGFPKCGDVLFTTEAPLGNVAQLDTDDRVIIGQRLITMQPDERILRADFLKWLLMSPQTQSEIWRRATGATVQGIKARLLKLVIISAPDLSMQSDISRMLDTLAKGRDSLVAEYGRKLILLSELKQSLLHSAFSGRLASDNGIAA